MCAEPAGDLGDKLPPARAADAVVWPEAGGEALGWVGGVADGGEGGEGFIVRGGVVGGEGDVVWGMGVLGEEFEREGECEEGEDGGDGGGGGGDGEGAGRVR